MVDYSFVTFDREWSREHDNNRYERTERVAWWRTKKKIKKMWKYIKNIGSKNDKSN